MLLLIYFLLQELLAIAVFKFLFLQKGDVLVGSNGGKSSTGELCALYKPADSETFEPLSNILTLPDFCFATISPSGDTIFVADSTTTYNLLKVKTDSSYAIALSDAEAGQNVEIALEGLFDLPVLHRVRKFWTPMDTGLATDTRMETAGREQCFAKNYLVLQAVIQGTVHTAA